MLLILKSLTLENSHATLYRHNIVVAFVGKTYVQPFVTYIDFISQPFIITLIFYIINADIDIFILIILCCSAGTATCHQTRYI